MQLIFQHALFRNDFLTEPRPSESVRWILKFAPDKNGNIPKLLQETVKQLKLSPKDIPEEAKASETIKGILGSLCTIVYRVSELRKAYGTGHGQHAEFKGLSLRHAKLVVGSASTLAIFLLETHEIRD